MSKVIEIEVTLCFCWYNARFKGLGNCTFQQDSSVSLQKAINIKGEKREIVDEKKN